MNRLAPYILALLAPTIAAAQLPDNAINASGQTYSTENYVTTQVATATASVTALSNSLGTAAFTDANAYATGTPVYAESDTAALASLTEHNGTNDAHSVLFSAKQTTNAVLDNLIAGDASDILGSTATTAAAGDHNHPLTAITNLGALAGEDWPTSDGQEYIAKNGAWAVKTDGSGGTAPGSYISGCWVTFADTNTVTIAEGDGYCAGTYYCITSSVSHDMTSLQTAEGFNYVYLDYDASTFPSSVSMYDSTSTPTYVAAYAGYYCATSTADRFLGSVWSTNGVAALRATYRVGNVVHNGARVKCASDMQPDATWQTPDDYETSVLFPSTASWGLFYLYGRDTTSFVNLGITTYELAVQIPTSTVAALDFYYGYFYLGAYPMIPLGPSRNVRIYGQADDDAQLSLWVIGWVEDR